METYVQCTGHITFILRDNPWIKLCVTRVYSSAFVNQNRLSKKKFARLFHNTERWLKRIEFNCLVRSVLQFGSLRNAVTDHILALVSPTAPLMLP